MAQLANLINNWPSHLKLSTKERISDHIQSTQMDENTPLQFEVRLNFPYGKACFQSRTSVDNGSFLSVHPHTHHLNGKSTW